MGLDAQVAESTALHDRLMASARYVSQVTSESLARLDWNLAAHLAARRTTKTWLARASGHGAHTM